MKNTSRLLFEILPPQPLPRKRISAAAVRGQAIFLVLSFATKFVVSGPVSGQMEGIDIRDNNEKFKSILLFKSRSVTVHGQLYT